MRRALFIVVLLLFLLFLPRLRQAQAAKSPAAISAASPPAPVDEPTATPVWPTQTPVTPEPPTGDIVGRVARRNGDPFHNVTVHAGTSLTTTTNVNGDFWFVDKTPGITWQIWLDSQEYPPVCTPYNPATWYQYVIVVAGEEVRADFVIDCGEVLPSPTAEPHTATPAPTFTSVPTDTPTPTPTEEVPTATPTPSVTASASPSPTGTKTPSPTPSATLTTTPTGTNTPTATPTSTQVPTFTPTPTFTLTPTATRTATPTVTATLTSSPTSTSTATRTPTRTPTVTPTPRVEYRVYLPLLRREHVEVCMRMLVGLYTDRWGNPQSFTLAFSPYHADVRSVGVLPYGRYVHLRMNDWGLVGQAYLQYDWYSYLDNHGPQWGFYGVWESDWPPPVAQPYDLRLAPGRQHIFGVEYEDHGILCLAALKMQWDPPTVE